MIQVTVVEWLRVVKNMDPPLSGLKLIAYSHWPVDDIGEVGHLHFADDKDEILFRLKYL